MCWSTGSLFIQIMWINFRFEPLGPGNAICHPETGSAFQLMAWCLAAPRFLAPQSVHIPAVHLWSMLLENPDDVMTWEWFPHCWPFLRGILIRSLYFKSLVFPLLLAWKKLLNKELSCRWFEVPWSSCDVTVKFHQIWCCYLYPGENMITWVPHDDVIKWKHFPLLALFASNSPVTGEFPSQRPVTRSFDVFFDLHMNKQLSKQSWGWWFEMPSCSLWCHCNDFCTHAWSVEIVLFWKCDIKLLQESMMPSINDTIVTTVAWF